jgi:hypothetical protein
MRSLSITLASGSLLLLAGCVDSKWAFLRRQETPQVYANGPTAEQLVAYLNRNAEQITSLQCMHVDLDCKYRFQQFHVAARMVCEKPRNFRLVAQALGNTEADIGSNRDEFWLWLRRNEPPYLLHCSYQALDQGGVQLPFPVQPDWVMEALGMATYPADGRYQVNQNRRNGLLELVQDGMNQGRQVKRVTVFDNRPDARVHVKGHILRDEHGHDICAAHVRDVEMVGGVVVPRKIDLVYPSERLEMRFTLFTDASDVVLNRPVDADQAQALFSRPNLRGVQTYDLGATASSQVSPAGGYLAR